MSIDKSETQNRSRKADEKVKETMAFLDQAQANAVARFKVTAEKDDAKIGTNHPNQDAGQLLLMKAIGVPDLDFLNGTTVQLVNASSRDGKPNERELNFLLSVIKCNQPRDHNEVMLSAQMGTVHAACMNAAQILANASSDEKWERAERVFSRLARTFANQMETLKRYRTGAEPQVVVQNVIATEGAKAAAVVSNVTPTNNEPLSGGAATTSAPQADFTVTPIASHRRRQGAHT